jgi:hypothetical protein
MTNLLTKIQWSLYILFKNKIFGIELGYALFLISGVFVIFLSYFFFLRWKRDVGILTGFYIAFLMGLLSQPLYLGVVFFSKGLREALHTFFYGTRVIVWGSAFLLSFLYLLLFHRKKLPDTYDHLFPFFCLLHGIFHLLFFGLGWYYGKPTDLPWGVVFHPDSSAGKIYGSLSLHPLQLYNLIGSFIILPPSMYFLKRRRFEGEVSLWIIFYAGFMKTIEKLFFAEKRGNLFLFIIPSLLSISLIIYFRLRNGKFPSFK